jgi:pimeloyl-ACP methyl ester carboxylesterase
MGAHTAAGFALAHPERVAALVAVTPASTGEPSDELAEWDALADGLEHGGVDGFLAAWRPEVGERWQDTVRTVARQRLERHRHPGAVADALRAVPRSAPFDGLDALSEIDVPALVVGSRDDADPGHPLAVAQAWAQHLPDAELAVEEPGSSPLAWQGAQLSRAILEFLARRSLDR